MTVNEKLEELRLKETRREEGDLRKVLSLKEGRRFIWKLLSDAGIFKGGYVGDNKAFFDQGKKCLGLGVFSDVMTVDGDSFVRMQKENASLEASKDMEISKIKKLEEQGE